MTTIRWCEMETEIATLAKPVQPTMNDGEHDMFSHWSKRADVARAYVTGEAITALCGKKWVPTRDPSRYPICPTCTEIKNRMGGQGA